MKKENVLYPNIKNSEIRKRLDKAKYVKYNPSIHLTISDLGYNSIYQICDLSKKRWEHYFQNGGGLYLNNEIKRHFVASNQLVLFDWSSNEILRRGVSVPTKQLKPKRNYNKGNLARKAGGINLYLQKNDRFTKNDRAKFLMLAENYISKYNSLLPINSQHNHLDASLSDLENLEIWNNFFTTNGPAIEELNEKWMKHFGIKSKSNTKITEGDIIYDDIEKLEKLKLIKTKKSKYIDLGF